MFNYQLSTINYQRWGMFGAMGGQRPGFRGSAGGKQKKNKPKKKKKGFG